MTFDSIRQLASENLPVNILKIFTGHGYPENADKRIIDAAYLICNINIPQRDYPIGLQEAREIVEDYIQSLPDLNEDLINGWHKILEELNSLEL